MSDAQDAKRQVLDLVGSQRSYENRGSHRGSDGQNRSENNRDYGSQRNQRNQFGSTSSATNDRAGDSSYSNTQQNNDTSEPMEYEMIDWQAAARESVCICTLAQWHNNKFSRSFLFSFLFFSSFFFIVGRTKSQALGCIAAIAKVLLQRTSRCKKYATAKSRSYSPSKQQHHSFACLFG